MNLFQKVNFVSHAGLPLTWKIECDALSPEDWEGLAEIALSRGMLPSAACIIHAVPRGGFPLALAVSKYVKYDDFGPVLIVDDVMTTGKSMVETAAKYPSNKDVWGLVAFLRNKDLSLNWVRSILSVG